MLADVLCEHFEHCLEFCVIGEVLLCVAVFGQVVVSLLDLEVSHLCFITLLLVQSGLNHVHQNRKHLVVHITDFDQALSYQKSIVPSHCVFLS